MNLTGIKKYYFKTALPILNYQEPFVLYQHSSTLSDLALLKLSDQPILKMHNSSFKIRTTLRWIQESKLSFKHHSLFNVYVYARDRSNVPLFNTVCIWYYETNFRGIRHLTMSRKIYKSVLLQKINRFSRKDT